MNDFIRHVRDAALLRDGGGLTDSHLLECFVTRRDETAFAALVRRHGPMVLGVCRRVLGHHHDAEDALQATFLVLARKAASLKARELLGPWLYGVAYRTALRAREMNARRRAKEERAREMTRPAAPADDGWQELLPLLDRELNGLPERYRVAVVLCDLEGVTRREAARRLDLPEGTLSGRLTRARRLLAKRLARYGLAVSGGTVAAALGARPASAGVTGALAAATARAAAAQAAGNALTAGAVPARVIALAEGVVRTMFLAKLKTIVALGLVVFAGAGVVGLAYRTTAAEPQQPAGAAAAPGAGRPTADDLEELRLEVAALRKGLQNTREQVKELQGEVQALKTSQQSANRGGGGLGALGGGYGALGGPMQPVNPYGALGGMQPVNPYSPSSPPAGVPGKAPASPMQSPNYEPQGHNPPAQPLYRQPKASEDPVAEAEAALHKLRQDPTDKQAADALEGALMRLKERAKPEGHTGTPQKE